MKTKSLSDVGGKYKGNRKRVEELSVKTPFS